MFKYKEKENNIKQKSISLTAYRTLLVFAKLLHQPSTKDQLKKVLSFGSDEEMYSKDTLRRTLNTLKKSGCVISRPTEKNGYTYSLISHPFLPEIKNAEFLNKLRKNFVLNEDWESVYRINELYDSLISICKNEELREKLADENPLGVINKNILKKFISGELWQKVIEIGYSSANSGPEILRFIPERMSMKNSKLYIWGYNFKYNQYAFLNLERIKTINAVYYLDTEITLPAYEITYKLAGKSKITFTPEKNEEIIERSENEIVVQMIVSDEFSMFQRLLPFALDLKSIQPEYASEQFCEKLRRIKRSYEE